MLLGSQTGRSPAPTLPWGQWASLRYTSFAGGGGGAVVDSKNMVFPVNSSACRVCVTFLYSTTYISLYKSIYTFRVFLYFLQLHFRGHFRVHFRTSTPTFSCGRTATFLFYTYTHLWMYSGLYSATATFPRPFSCTFSYIHAYIHPWTHSDVSILHLHSSVDVQRSLQCYSYIFVHPHLHSSVDAQRRLYSTPTLTCGCTAVSTVLQLHFRGHFRVHYAYIHLWTHMSV